MYYVYIYIYIYMYTPIPISECVTPAVDSVLLFASSSGFPCG